MLSCITAEGLGTLHDLFALLYATQPEVSAQHLCLMCIINLVGPASLRSCARQVFNGVAYSCLRGDLLRIAGAFRLATIAQLKKIKGCTN